VTRQTFRGYQAWADPIFPEGLICSKGASLTQRRRLQRGYRKLAQLPPTEAGRSLTAIKDRVRRPDETYDVKSRSYLRNMVVIGRA